MVAIVANSVEKEVSTKHNILCHPVGIRLPTFLHRLKLKDRIINTNMTVRYGQETTVKRGVSNHYASQFNMSESHVGFATC